MAPFRRVHGFRGQGTEWLLTMQAQNEGSSVFSKTYKTCASREEPMTRLVRMASGCWLDWTKHCVGIVPRCEPNESGSMPDEFPVVAILRLVSPSDVHFVRLDWRARRCALEYRGR